MVQHTKLVDNESRTLQIREYNRATYPELLIEFNGAEMGIDITPVEAEELKHMFEVEE